MMSHLIAIALGLAIDRIVGDPPNWPHPVRWIGTAIRKLTNRWNHGPNNFRNGFLLLGTIAFTVFLIVYAFVALAYSVNIFAGIALEALFIASGLAQKSLKDAAMDVYNPLMNKKIALAREKLSWIVGRDTADLNESEITRGVVETVSENTSDGVTAPLFWAFLLGAPGLWLYKAVNTLDSMVGYQNEEYEKFGFASAKADDMLNFIPSRLTGFLILVMTENKQTLSLRQRFAKWLQDAPKHPSPNSGWLEAATAVQLGIELGGVNRYRGVESYRARMGTSVYPLEAHHIHEAVSHMQRVTIGFFILFALGGVLLGIA
ncbi:cobalamin biosynthesis protein [Planococcus antarcticus DSM 14505]|uniref:Cobalamin biosynthesis protein CobD n=1 Tax=Planococcus antarcticus DSM 14505 TaxID=1185653 RepID=A0A1C7DEZ1_9BACL|nr:adenosylcobinamide-phosphate synthase CbiB [Planococcus antarcticus]ANU10015.1 cobalamin biosynthesis protein CobD [Planococcus antarcticus DSM 14505]EIM07402.1 cobalamin biosynthesis protein [Planococcus antarcticus DSM 14505]